MTSLINSRADRAADSREGTALQCPKAIGCCGDHCVHAVSREDAVGGARPPGEFSGEIKQNQYFLQPIRMQEHKILTRKFMN